MTAHPRGRWILSTLLMIAVGTGIGFSMAQPIASRADVAGDAGDAETNTPISRTRDGIPYIVDPSSLVDTGVSRDSIAPITEPQFETVHRADTWLEDDAWVLILEYNGVLRAYPVQILVWHEVVNDTVAGDPLLVTYCPLCACSAVYLRTVADRALTFGTSGKVFNSNLVMYDRETGSYWSQLIGVSLVGDLAGKSLARVPATLVQWSDCKRAHPDAEVLSRETGFDRDYDQNPYDAYLQDSAVCFPLSGRDDRLPVKTPVFGVELGESSVAVVAEALMESGSIEVHVGGERVGFVHTSSGAVHVSNLDTGASLIAVRAFWFAWYAFYPETQLFDPSSL